MCSSHTNTCTFQALYLFNNVFIKKNIEFHLKGDLNDMELFDCLVNVRFYTYISHRKHYFVRVQCVHALTNIYCVCIYRLNEMNWLSLNDLFSNTQHSIYYTIRTAIISVIIEFIYIIIYFCRFNAYSLHSRIVNNAHCQCSYVVRETGRL